MDKSTFFKLSQRRIAQTAINAQALRNQGDPGMVAACRHYFEHHILLDQFFAALLTRTISGTFSTTTLSVSGYPFPKAAARISGLPAKHLICFCGK